MSFEKTFDELLVDILTDYENLDDAPDTSKGSMAFIKAACLASAAWGIYQYQHFIWRQAVPIRAVGRSEGGTLDDWCAIWDIYRDPGENDTALLEKLVAHFRNPPAGGRDPDYIRWAKEVDGVGFAWIFKDNEAQGLGSIDLVVTGPLGNEVLDSAKRQEIWAYIDDARPAGLYLLRILPFTTQTVNVTMTLGGGSAVAATVAAEITAYLNSLAPGQTVYRSQLVGIAIGQGAANPVVTLPAADVTMSTSNHPKAVAGIINVT